MNTEQIKKDFSIFSHAARSGKPLVYLDNAATSQTPDEVLEAMNAYYQKYRSNIHRGVYAIAERATSAYEGARLAVAEFIGAGDPGEIIFTRGTTEGLNILASRLTLGLSAGDEVAVSEMEHHANLVPWMQAVKARGLTLRFLPVRKDGRLDIEAARAIIGPRVKIVSLCHASNALGLVNPVHEIADMAHAHGAVVVVDGAQSVPHLPVNVEELGADFFAFSGHKMFGPTGIGVLWGKKALLEKMEPFLYGGDMIQEVTLDGATWTDVPWKFEGGTPPIAEAIGLAAAVRYLRRLGMENVVRHERELTRYALERMSALGGVMLYPAGDAPDAPDRIGVIAFNIEKVHPHDAASILDRHGIAVRAGHHCAMPLLRKLGINFSLRASFSAYNTREDVDLLIAAIADAQKIFHV
ncbi:MAG: cysteine desulfurase [Patescibacteria group bacterium]